MKPRQYILNRDELLANNPNDLWRVALDMVEHALKAADPYRAVMNFVKLEGDRLFIGDDCFELAKYERIFVLGAGKASLPIAQALEEILGDRITEGLFILKYGEVADLKKIQVIYGSHPVPDENGCQGARKILRMADSFTEKDLVITGITGGSSALMPVPVDGVSLEDKQKATRILLHCGADIKQINTVRKHLSQIKGGFLAKRILPSTLINLTVSDVVGDALDYITDPTVADTSTFEDARKVFDIFDLWDKMPLSVCSYIRNAGPELETPKCFDGEPIYNYIVVPGAAAAEGAAEFAASCGFSPMILTSMLKGEAREAGVVFASIANEICQFGRPVQRPCALIAAGENTVTIQDCYGEGGANQEFAISACIDIAGNRDFVVVSIDTDGTDGASKFAGGIADGKTLELACKKNMDLQKSLRGHNISPMLRELGGGIYTGPTGTNLNDLKFVLIK